jgi:hypothetical protein
MEVIVTGCIRPAQKPVSRLVVNCHATQLDVRVYWRKCNHTRPHRWVVAPQGWCGCFDTNVLCNLFETVCALYRYWVLDGRTDEMDWQQAGKG